MSLSFSNSTGNLFNRLGKVGLAIKQYASYQTSQKPNLIDTTNGIVAQLNAESDIQAIIGDSYIGLLNSGAGGLSGVMQQLASAIVNRMVFRDNPLFNQNLQQSNTLASLLEVIRQMKAAGASVLAMTVAGTPTVVTGQPGPYFTGTGNGVINVSLKRPFDGLALENAFAERLLFTVTGDSYSGSATAANEPLTVNGVGSEGDLFAFDWPLGSNCLIGVSATDAASDNSNGNFLTNSAFDSFTSNVPDNWTLVLGTGGSNVFEEDTLVYDSPPNKALRLLGDGTTNFSLKQQFNVSTGTLGQLSPQTAYSFCIFARRDGVTAANGTLTVDLVDQNNVVIEDAAGINNTFNIDLTGLTVNYAPYTGAFRTPSIMPTSQYLRMRLTGTGLTNNRSVYFDFGSLTQMSQTYTAGPFVAVHAGSIPFQVSDWASAIISSSRNANLNSFQVLLSRLFPDAAYGQGLLYPSSSTPTISDTLIG